MTGEKGVCGAPGCEKPRRGRYCSMHTERLRVHGSLDKPKPRPREPKGPCSRADCMEPASIKGLCVKHYKRKWHEENWTRTYAAQVERRAANRDAYLEANSAYYQANRDLILARMRARYAENPESFRKKSKEWSRANPIRRREHELRRRARMRETQVEPVRYDEILAERGMVCHLCGDEIADSTDLHFDHVIPLAKGGTHTRENIKPAHASCNMHKHTTMPSGAEGVMPG